MADTKRPVSARRRARELSLRVLFQAEVAEEPLQDVARAVIPDSDLSAAGRDFAMAIVDTVASRSVDIDRLISEHAEHWSLQRMATTDRNVLRLAVGELIGFPDTDARVVLDEAVSIAIRFGTDASGRFVNGLLDRIARVLRPDEFDGG